MATALPTVAVSLVFMLWDACRRVRRRPTAPEVGDPSDGGAQHVEHRLDCLTVMVRPLPRRLR